MLNKTLKSIAAVLISLAVLAGSVPAVVAAEITEPAVTEPIVTEPVVTEPIVTEPVSGETTLPVDNSGELSSDPTVTDPSMTDPVTDPAVIDPALPGAETDLPLANDDIARPVFAVQWGMLPMYMGSNGVFQWSVALDNGGYYIYTVTNMYESAQFTISYDEDGDELLRYEANTQPVILDSLWNPIPGAYVQSYVENNTRYSEIYIPQSFFKDILFTITCGQSVNSLDITDSFGMPAMPAIWGDVATLEEPVAMNNEAFVSMVAAMASRPGSDNVFNWNIVYENGNYVFYLVGNKDYYQAQMNIGYTPVILLSDNDNVQFGWGNTIASNCKQSYKSDKNYVKYTVPADKLPADFTISYANTTLTSAEIKASSGAVNPDVPDVPDTPEQPTDNSAFIEEVNSALASANCSGSNWGIIYKDGCYNLYIKGNQWGCSAGFNFISGSYSWVSADPVNNNPVTINGVSTPVTKIVESDSTYYALYSIPESVLPAEFKIQCNQGDVSSDAIKLNGSVSEDYRIAAAVQSKVGNENWAVELGSDGRYHLYIIDAPSDIPAVAVIDKLSGESSNPALSPVAVAEKDGLRYSEYILSELTQWFDISYNGQTKTFGSHPEQAFIDSVTANADGSWDAVLNDDGSFTIYVESDTEPSASAFTFVNRAGEDTVAIDEALTKTVYNPETGRYYTQLIVSNASEWFDVTYNGVTKTVGENPDQATIDRINKKAGADGWKIEKGADGLYHVYIIDYTGDTASITVTDKTDGSTINADFTAVQQVTDENGRRYSEYTASIDSEWFDISYNGNEPVSFGKDPNAAYAGIVIDGEFADWDAVPRYPFYDNPEHNGQVPYTSMVWDGDRVYIYLESKLDDDPNQPANNFWVFANSGYNGVYEIRTDLNKRLIFQVCPIDSPNHCYIAGVEGAEIKVTDNPHGPNYCEISIPTSELPEYLNTISFGAYLYDTSIPNVGNMNDPQAGMDKSFNGIVYDGHYTDWAYYPHSIIYYDGQGIHVNESNAIDGEQALWSNGETIFGHVVTEHIDHLAEGGGEFTEAVTLRVNDNLDFYPRAVRVDSDGTIHWNDSQVKNLPDGEYEFYLFDTNAWSNCTNIHEFEDPNVDPNRRGTQQIYGKIHITVGASKDECEYYVYAEALAKKFNIDPEDIKTVSSQFGRIGQQWATTAGTSTGAFLGIFLCLATVSGTYFFKKKKAMGIK